nr:substrate-binding domain-containing protein [Streptomyces sp. SID8499]
MGLVVPEAQEYFAEIVRGVRDAVHAAGAHLMLGLSGYDRDQDEEQPRRLLEAGAAGLLLSPGWMHDGSEQEDSRLDFGVPTVLLERRAAPGTEAAEFDSVCSDHAAGAGLAVRHLLSLGRDGIALVAGGSATTVAMRSGYEAALRVAGAQPVLPPVELYTGKLDPGSLQRAAARLAEAVDAGTVDAAVVLSDTDAMIILQTLRTIAPHIDVPRDLALVAYGDQVAALSDLPLTAVAPPKYEVGQEAAELLLRRVRDRQANGTRPAAPRHLALLPELRVRRSCGGAASHDEAVRQA